MTAYYNEIDPFAVQVLRELIGVGAIADGIVDDRSIEAVEPRDLVGFTQCHFFAGFGVWSYALRLAGWRDDRPVWTGSPPCQPFSTAGKKEGFDDPRHLWPAWFRLVREFRPVAIFGEQVESAIRAHWLDLVSTDLEGIGYAVGSAVFGSHSVGAPHRRQRLYLVADKRAWNSDSERETQECGVSEKSGIEPERSRARVGGLSDSDEQRHSPLFGEIARDVSSGRQSRGTFDGPQRSESVSGMADAVDDGRRRGRLAQPEGEVRSLESARPSASSDGLGDAALGRFGIGGNSPLPRRLGYPDRAIAASLLDDASRERLQGLSWYVDDCPEPRRVDPLSIGSTPAPSILGGFWADAEWVECSDGKARPVEPGSFPLAYGSPARVGRLRGYGNAINGEAAAAFVQAYREVRGEL